MPGMDDFHAYKSTSGGSDGSKNRGGGGFGCGWIVIVIVVILLISFIADGASWDAIAVSYTHLTLPTTSRV